jgi:Flp pilus assembly protein TadG
MGRNSESTSRAAGKMRRQSKSRIAKSAAGWAARQLRFVNDGARGILRDESGQAAAFAAVCLIVIMSAMALAIDVGHLRFKQQQLQTVADAAALAGALEIQTCGSTSNCTAMQSASQTAVTENGLGTPTVVTQCASSTAAGVILEVNNGPCALGAGDPNEGNSQYVETVVIQKLNTFFGAVIGIRQITLTARSEATSSGSSSGACSGCCLYAGSIAFNSSNGSMNMTCGIFDNGNLQTDNGDSATTPTFKYAGSWSPNNCNSTCTWSDAAPTYTSTHASDPLASLSPPSQPSASSTASNTTPNNGATLQPGYYANGINLNSNVSVTLAPGTYYMNGSINVDSGATLSGTGVTLYFTSGSLQPNSGSTVQLTAPTTGSDAGMLIWESSSNSSGMNMDAGSSSYFQGVIYLPDATLTLNSSSGSTVNGTAAYTVVDVNSLILDSSETFDIKNNYSTLPGGTSPLNMGGTASAALAE